MKEPKTLGEGDIAPPTVIREFMGDVSLSIPRAALRYLDVKVGSQVTILARNGKLIITAGPAMYMFKSVKKIKLRRK